jgi:hypothetical protein
MRPNFFVIGAAKCATSSLCALIGAHREAFMCDPKEPFFFSRDRNYLGKGWPWYESLFSEARGKLAIGEGSVHYSQRAIYPNVAPRIAADVPKARLIYITRDPLRQIESHWIMLRSFWRAVREDGIRTDSDFNRSVRETMPVLLEAARYWEQISWYRDYFSNDQILVLFYEDFKQNGDAVLARCFEFLGIDPQMRIPDSEKPVNVSKHHRYDRWFFKPVRLLPGMAKIRSALPEGVHDALKPVLRRPVGGRPQWNTETRKWVLDQLAEESRTFLSHYGKPADFWDHDG